MVFEQSEFGKKLIPLNRILEEKGHYVWGCSPIYDEAGKVHVFYSRWNKELGMFGWVAACEVAHAVADRPEGPYVHVNVVLKGRGGCHWDSWSIHNPTVHKVGNKYLLLYMGADGSGLGKTLAELVEMDHESYLPYFHKLVQTKRVGMAVADSLDGPWTRVSDEVPIVDVGPAGSWDDFCTSNPGFVVTPDNRYRIYYKAWDHVTAQSFNGNRKYGFTEADDFKGPYIKCYENPVVDYTYLGEKIQAEDAYVWYEDDRYKMIMRDMGVYNHEYGLFIESEDGSRWSAPTVSFLDAPSYFKEPLPGIYGEGRFERPQLLIKNGHPTHLFCAYRGGRFGTASGVVLKIQSHSRTSL